MARSTTRDVRELLLAAGVRTLSKAGFNGCSVQDITDAAGVPKGSFYNHFESKEALGVAVLDRYWTEGACDRLRILGEAGVSPRHRLQTYFEQVTADMVGLDFTCGCLIGNMAAELSDHSAAISAKIASILAGWSRRVSDCIREAQAADEIRTRADPDLLAAFVLNAWEGAVLRARIEKGERPLRQFIEILFTQLLH